VTTTGVVSLIDHVRVMTDEPALRRVTRARITEARVGVLATPEAAAARRVVDAAALVLRHPAGRHRRRPSCRIRQLMTWRRRHDDEDAGNSSQTAQQRDAGHTS